ncbi:MAG: outer membrane beta-barrel protein [Bacteroidales bacterium]|nr:outer membrane beta-barrel protein [Bacteroidales bacterium]
MKNFLKIKILIIAHIIFIILSQSTQAQQKPFKFGFKLSPSISWLSPDSKYYENDGSDMSFSWGFIADITLMEHYYIATGFNVNYFRGSLSYPEATMHEDINYNGTLNRTYNLRYIEVPVTLKMKTNELVKKTKFFGLIGVNTGLNIRAKANDSFSGKYNSTTHTYSEEKVDIKNETTLFKASLVVGAGAEYVVDESLSVIIGINFNNGFTNILKGNNSIYPEIEAKAVPYYFELNLGVIF